MELLVVVGILVIAGAIISIGLPILAFLGVVAVIAWLISEALSVPFTPTFWVVLVVGAVGLLVTRLFDG